MKSIHQLFFKNNTFIIGLSLLLIFASCGSIEKHNLQISKLHPVSDLHEDIDKVYEQLQRNHPRLYQFTTKEVLDFKFDSLKKAITTPMDSRTFYKELATVTKYVGQGHMTMSPPREKFNRKERKALRKTKFDLNNLDFEYLDDKLFIVNARNKDSVLINAEVLEVEGEKSQDIIRRLKRVIASDGYNTTLHNRVVGRRFLGYYVNDKGRFDSLTLKLKNADSTFTKIYKRTLKKDTTTVKKDSIKQDVVKRDSLVTKKKIKLTRSERKAKKAEEKAKQKYKSKRGFIASRKEYTRNLTFTGKDSTVAMLKIRGFTRGKYKDFYNETFKTLDSLKTETLIIDLRNNFGGRLNEITYLYGFFTDENFTMINPSEVNSRFIILKSIMSNTSSTSGKIFGSLFSPIFATVDLLKTHKKDGQIYYKFKSAKEKEPQEHNFKGKVYVMTNGNSFSASSLIATQLQGSKRATIVGEETGGAYNGTVAGLYKVYELPNTKVRARIGLAHIDVRYKTSPDGYGVKPDVEVLPTLEDRLNNVDAELEWILKDLEQKK